MKKILVLALISQLLVAYAQKAKDATIEENIQFMYDDVMSRYHTAADGQKYAYDKYASVQLMSLMKDVDAAIEKSEIPPEIYGWD